MFEVIALVAGFVLLLVLMTYAARKSRGLDKKYYSSHWKKINETFALGESGMRLAVIDADKLVDQALKQSGVRGNTMGERMKSANYLKNINNLWSAHKLRNKLVHEPDMRPKTSEMKAAMQAYSKTLKEVGAL